MITFLFSLLTLLIGIGIGFFIGLIAALWSQVE